MVGARQGLSVAVGPSWCWQVGPIEASIPGGSRGDGTRLLKVGCAVPSNLTVGVICNQNAMSAVTLKASLSNGFCLVLLGVAAFLLRISESQRCTGAETCNATAMAPASIAQPWLWVAVGDTEMPYMCQVVISQRAGKYVGGRASVIASNWNCCWFAASDVSMPCLSNAAVLELMGRHKRFENSFGRPNWWQVPAL